MRKIYVGADGRNYDSDNVVIHYCPESDMTFITYEIGYTVEVVGFYYGEPSEIKTEECIGSTTAYIE